MYVKQTIASFLKNLSSASPCPGGGSAACLVGALGISLALMVGGILLKKKGRNRVSNGRLLAGMRQLSKLKALAIRSIDGDIRAYRQVTKAYAFPKEIKTRRTKIEHALKGAYFFQKGFAEVLIKASGWVGIFERVAGGSIASDLILSRYFLRAGFLGACQTARINLEYMKDRNFIGRETERLRSLHRQFNKVSGNQS
jgi:formiminotetrahydrofolate cyclodeaminase